MYISKLWSFVNEEKLIKDLLKDNGLVNKNPRDYIVAYIKYLKNEKNLSKSDIRNELDNFLLSNLTGFIVADWDTRLQRWVNKYSKKANCEYKKGKRIVITEEELQLISEVGDVCNVKAIEVEKILFIMLILGKSTHNEETKDYWCNYESKDIFKLARYKYKKVKGNTCSRQRECLLHNLKEKTKDKYVEFVGINIKLLYGVNSDNIAIDEIIDESNIDNIIIKYLEWRNLKGYNYCVECGKEIKLKTKNSKYCDKCAKIKEKEKYIKYNKKRK